MTRTRAYLLVSLFLSLLALTGCLQEPAPTYCYRVDTGATGAEAWYCSPGAEYPRDTLPDAMKLEGGAL
jgi:hypothetical protein